MLVLIDESGDPGFKIVRGSSPHFIVAMVIFRDYPQAERTSAAIANARTLLRVHPEFKFNKCCDQVRDRFFETVLPFDFTIRALVVDKAKIYSEHLRENKEHFYNYFVQLLLRHDHGVLSSARVKIDGSGDREFKRELGRYLRQQVQVGKIQSVKFAESHRDNLIQLADMTAGAIARSYRPESRDNPHRWRQRLANAGKIEDVWDFG